MISNLPSHEKLSIPLNISSEFSTSLASLTCKKVEASCKAKEQLSRCTGTLSTLLLAGNVSEGETKVSVVFLSAARFRSTSAGPGSCTTEKAGAPGLKIPDLCQAMSSTVGPSWATWSSPKEVMPVTMGFRTTFVAQYSPPWWVSTIAASTPSLINVWKANSSRSCRYRGCLRVPVGVACWGDARVSHTSKKYLVKRSSVIGWLLIWILSRMHCRSGDVYSPIRFGNPVLRPWA